MIDRLADSQQCGGIRGDCELKLPILGRGIVEDFASDMLKIQSFNGDRGIRRPMADNDMVAAREWIDFGGGQYRAGDRQPVVHEERHSFSA